MGWGFVIIVAILIIGAFFVFKSLFTVRGLQRSIDKGLKARLEALGFSPAVLQSDDKAERKLTALYHSDRFELRFTRERQQLFADLSPLAENVLPNDLTLTAAMPRASGHTPAYDVWDMLDFMGVTLSVDPYAVRKPAQFKSLLQGLKKELPQLRPFILGDLQLFIPYRRHCEILKLEYTWKNRSTYQECESLERRTLEQCRAYAQRWQDDGDDHSAAHVLTIIESKLSAEEQERLRIAREKAGLAN